ncbi:MAG TPA: hypothetical protein PKA64_21930 [Myxococcota bacterium]|nr:hypothetical protein [Myxococcota bacterium]
MRALNVFISWGGPRSEHVATALEAWLPTVVQAVTPWRAPHIEGGLPWHTRLSAALKEHDYGIICVTRESLRRPWLHFEAGALASRASSHVIPYLIDADALQSSDPLWHLQGRRADREGTLELVRDLHRASLEGYPNSAFTPAKLQDQFQRCWPELERQLHATPASEEAPAPPVLDPVQDLLQGLHAGQRELLDRLERLERRDGLDPMRSITVAQPGAGNFDAPDVTTTKFE